MGVKRQGPPPKLPTIDAKAAEKVIRGYVVGAILERVARGLDTRGKPFRPYSREYVGTLRAGREDLDVDLRLTGGLLNSVKVRASSTTATSVSVTVAPDTGGSRRVVPRGGRMRRTSDGGPPHNVLGYWIHHGTATMPARPWLGLSPDQVKELHKLLRPIMSTPSQ